MPSRRDLIRMTPQEVDAYLRGQRRIVIVTNGANGLPHAVPMNYGVDGEGRVLITSFGKSQKVRNLERDPRATLLVESGETYASLKSVMLHCDVEIVTDPGAVAAGMRRIRADEQLSGSLSPEASQQVSASMAKRVLLRCAPFRTVSWDHGKLGAFY
jgi:PPOX class probable F420-dependent enzyme